MTFCNKCGHQLTDGARFCFACGAKIDSPAAVRGEQRKTVYDGEIHKCPNCGDILDAYESVCEACGYERRGAGIINSVGEFSKSLKFTTTEAQKADVIRSFPIPNNKEDIFEFLILASTNIDGQPNKIVFDAWVSKVEQCFQKAILAFSKTDDFEKIQKLYDRTVRSVRGIRRKRTLKKWLAIGIPILIFLSIQTAFWSAVFSPETLEEKIKSRESHLQEIVVDIEADISNGKFVDARNKAHTLTFDKELSEERSAHWEQKQQEILKQIDNACGGSYDETKQANAEFDYEWHIDEYSEQQANNMEEYQSYVDRYEDFIAHIMDPSEKNGDVTDEKKEYLPEETNKINENDSDKLQNTIEKGTEYSFMCDEWNVYIATAISDKIIKIENWDKSLSTNKRVSYAYEVGTYRIDEPEINFSWVDDKQTAFTIDLQDKRSGSRAIRNTQEVIFTINIDNSDKFKGTNYSKDIVCYAYQNDDWHMYRAIPLTETLIKIEVWCRSSSAGTFVYGYDDGVINIANNTEFEWTDNEHTAFTITMQDVQNKSNWRKVKLVAFTLENSGYTYENVMAYLAGDA